MVKKDHILDKPKGQIIHRVANVEAESDVSLKVAAVNFQPRCDSCAATLGKIAREMAKKVEAQVQAVHRHLVGQRETISRVGPRPDDICG